jgi:hypothetical protein
VSARVGKIVMVTAVEGAVRLVLGWDGMRWDEEQVRLKEETRSAMMDGWG